MPGTPVDLEKFQEALETDYEQVRFAFKYVEGTYRYFMLFMANDKVVNSVLLGEV